MKYARAILIAFSVMVFGYILLGELFMPANSPRNGDVCSVLPGDQWVRVLPDGTRTPFTVPGRVEGDAVLETTLPETIDRDVSVLCFRGMDMDVYIDGALRTSYAAKDYKLLGDRSAECYVMASLYPEDAGKTLTVRYSYNSGMIYEVYIGTRIGILAYLFRLYGAELLVGLAILLLAMIGFIASVCYRLIHKQYLEMQDLSLGVLYGAVWVLSNSIFRQLFTRNVSVMSDTPFLMVLIMPLPFLIFINSLQEWRYYKVTSAVCALEVVGFVACIALFVSGKLTLTQSFPISAGCALVSILTITATILMDVKRHLIDPYRYVAIGFGFLGIAAIVQILMFQFAHNGVFSGLFMAIGLFGFFIFAIIHTIKQLIGNRLVANEALNISRAKDNFLANMSHEIRTPLNGILGMDEMIIRDTKEAQTKRYALNIRSAGVTLLSIINDILDMNKIESGKFEIFPSDYDVASVFNDVINITRPKATEKGLEYRFSVAEDIPSVLYGDALRIQQIMLNIINNAIKYTKKGFVDVGVSSAAGAEESLCSLTIRVSDSGSGIKEEDKAKLFKSFQRLDETKNRSIEGTGLGLHITQRLTQMMGGSIDVQSEYGKGSTFTVSLPQRVIRQEPIGDFSKAVNNYLSQTDANETTLYAPGASVLVVDDNEMNLDVIEGLLRDTKIRIDRAISGAECLELAQKKTYDCILLDQMMPEMSGEETLRELGSLHVTDNTPVVALTADAVVGARESYLAMGFTDYLSKPVKYEELEQALKMYLPAEKQLTPRAADEELPTMLVWGDDAARLKEEKQRLESVYKCVCVVGDAAMERYLAKHRPDGVLHIMAREEAQPEP